MKSKKVFCAFADSKLAYSAKRLQEQVERMDMFDKVMVLDETKLHEEFRSMFEDRFHLRGFGYWCWKPQVVLQAFETMEFGDIVQYADIGNHMNIEGKARMNDYFEMVENNASDFLVFEIESAIEKRWCKGDLLDFFEVRDRSEIAETPHFWSGAFFVRKTLSSQKILEEWLSVFIKHYSYIDDSESVSPNFEGFIESRHDQSVFSLLAKKYDFEKLNHRENTKYFADYPIIALRDKFDSDELSQIMAGSKISRVLKLEPSLLYKVRYIIEVLVGQNITQAIRKMIEKLSF